MPQITFSGLASGIDSDAVIKTLIDSRKLLAAPTEQAIERNENETTALEELSSKLFTLQDKLKFFTSAFGSGVYKKAQSSVPDAVGVSASNSAALSSTNIEILTIAKASSFSFDDRFSKTDIPIAPELTAPGKITIKMGVGKQQKSFEIEVNNQTTLSNLAASINAQAEDSLQAGVLNVGTEANPSYLLQVTGLESGVDKGKFEINISELPQNLFAALTLDQAQNAEFKVSGVGRIVRATNIVNDVIPGVTFELKQQNSGPVQLTVTGDIDKTSKQFTEVVEALNSLISFQKENDTITQSKNAQGQTVNNYGKLSYSRLDNQIIYALRNTILEAKSNIEGASVNVSADLGLSTQKDGTYKLKESDFLEALNKDPNGTTQLLQNISNKLASTTGLIDQYTRFNGNIALSIQNNNQENTSLREKLERMDKDLAKQEQNLRLIFANLEKTVSRLNADSSALTSILLSTQLSK